MDQPVNQLFYQPTSIAPAHNTWASVAHQDQAWLEAGQGGIVNLDNRVMINMLATQSDVGSEV